MTNLNPFNLHNRERVAIFVDGANTFNATRALNLSLDYKALLAEVKLNAYLVRAFYYTAMLDTERDEHNPIKKLVDWLTYNNYHTVTKLAKEYRAADGSSRTKGNMDIELAIDMLCMCEHYDVAMLFSGDGDFRRLVEEVQKRGKRVIVVSTFKSKPASFVSDDLRRQADEYFDLSELPEIMKPVRNGAVLESLEA